MSEVWHPNEAGVNYYGFAIKPQYVTGGRSMVEGQAVAPSTAYNKENAMDIAKLNERCGKKGTVAFAAGAGGLPFVRMTNKAAEAEVCLLGGHVWAFQRTGGRPVLWMSPKAVFAEGKPIRGGIPVCWPWFGALKDKADAPAHGYVRTRLWEVREVQEPSPSKTLLVLGLRSESAPSDLFPHPFDLTISVEVGDELVVDLVTVNRGAAAFSYTAALHTYFAVSEVRNVSVGGLDGCAYIDTVGGVWRTGQRQKDVVRFEAEVDRIYQNTNSECVINDPAWKRRIHVAKQGSASTVVWNPWTAKAERLTDLGGENYPRFVCVETTNAADDVVVVPAGETRHLTARIREELS